jgi:lipopolysaccharide transport system ATP-binding protein
MLNDMSNTAIRVENLSKKYEITLGRRRHDTLRDQIAHVLGSLFQSNGDSHAGTQTFWALKDVSFEIKPGEVIGIIGKNGAGKSTLLKILSRITQPTAGSAEIRGRVGSLLEVGIGFHGELSGRENIYLNGAILGMRKAEIDRKFDDIVAFAEVEKFIDTPVKRYSSGMYVRLAFAVAAHLEPEILIVDEVLAVGDVAFQKKCLGKMEHVATEGRTVLFVSHNMAAVENLCKKVIVLSAGEITFAGGTKEGIERYFQTVAGEQISYNPVTVDLTSHPGRPATYKPMLRSLEFFNGNGQPLRGGIKIGGSLKVAIRFRVERPLPNVDACIGFDTLTGQRVFTAHTSFEPARGQTDCVGERTYICEIPSLTLVAGVYKILVALGSAGLPTDLVEDAARIEILDSDYYGTGKSPWNGLIVLNHHWQLQ